MNALAPKKERGLGTTLQTAELVRAYSILGFLQPAGSSARRCVVCNCRVTNRNLGGNDGRSALTGELWCLRCADYPRQLVLGFGGSEQ
jgi:hypothetical protein